MLDFDIWLVCRGYGWLEAGSRHFNLAPGDCFIFSPGSSLKAEHNPKTPLGVVSSHFELAKKRNYSKPFMESISPYRRLADHSMLESLLTRVFHSHQTGEKENASIWMAAALTEYRTAPETTRVMSSDGEYQHLIEEICRQITLCPAKHYSVVDLAKRLHVCPDHFTRVFKLAKGVSPQEFLVSRRIEFAKDLLLQSNYSINRVAEFSGYESIYYFSKHFKKRTGSSPTAFRNWRGRLPYTSN